MAEARNQLKRDEGLDYNKISADYDQYAFAKDDYSSITKTLKQLLSDRKLELVTAAADAAGTLDPTPFSDTVGVVASVASGDYIGAGLSVLSMFPWLGDAVAKPIKRMYGMMFA